ncbi:ABC transporter permease [Paenibacillus psychroresistens]|uniref:ABC transporter permease n=1 Tax=Paenibacillus psychroresistens TaxID=1778678 RepID=A0A6B8RSX9_9BACL|nr:ABC transporter permease [Paenibacillus psychroresistens]QGQ98842.1 ABC transporter permease [Paenibacillus psychroresistens]
MNSIMTVIKFTFMNRFRAKSFKIMTVIFILLISVLVNLPSIISAFSSDKPTNVGVLASSSSDIPAQIQQYFIENPDMKIAIVPIPDTKSVEGNEKAAKAQIEAKKIKGYLQLFDDPASTFPKAIYKSEGSMEYSIKNKLQAGLQTIKQEQILKDLKLTEEQRTELNTSVAIDTEQITIKDGGTNQGKTEEQMAVAYGLVYVLLFLLFMSVQLFGNLIATEVTAEKSSRVMELLITSVSPLKQMFGKVTGMFLLGMTQLLAFGIAVAINIQLPNNQDFLADNNIHLNETPLSLLLYFVLFFILGFYLFAMLYAAVGSLVSRTEDLGQAVLPITFLSIGSFYIGIFGLNAPTSSFVTAMSFVPVFTPLIMFLRIGMTDPAAWQIWLSILLLLATIGFVSWLSAKVYRIGVLMYGKKPSFKEVFKAMRAYKA